MEPLKLLAQDTDDLTVVSTLLQDAVVKVRDMSFLPSTRRFAAVVNRFVWEIEDGRRRRTHARVRAGLHFENVLSARARDMPMFDREHVLSLLAIRHEPGEKADIIEIVFSGGPAIRLEVEALEVSLRDLGMAWETRNRPDHSAAEAIEAATKSGKDTA